MKVVMFVYNDVVRDSRVLREAGTLAAAGHELVIFGRPRDLDSKVEEHETLGPLTIHRIPVPHRWKFGWTFVRRPWGVLPWIRERFGRPHRDLARGATDVAAGLAVGGAAGAWTIAGAPVHLVGRRWLWRDSGTIKWLVMWRFALLGWAHRSADAAPPADVYHGHDPAGVAAAVRAARRNGGRAIYDSHEIFLESGTNSTRRVWARRLFARVERRWAAATVALVTVNDALERELRARLRVKRVVVVHNCPPRWTPPAERPDLIREACGIAPDQAIALYHGAFSAHRGLEAMAEALLEPGLERVHAVYLGYGGMRARLDALANDPRFGGRVHVIDAVPPDDLVPWVASADVDVMALEPSTLNHYLSTPNKLFESLAAGTPVVASDFPELRRVVIDDPDGPLGELCDPADPASIAGAIRAVVDLDPTPGADLRVRCLAAAHARWNWEMESAKLVALYAELGEPTSGHDGEVAVPGPGPDAGPAASGSTPDAGTAARASGADTPEPPASPAEGV